MIRRPLAALAALTVATALPSAAPGQPGPPYVPEDNGNHTVEFRDLNAVDGGEGEIVTIEGAGGLTGGLGSVGYGSGGGSGDTPSGDDDDVENRCDQLFEADAMSAAQRAEFEALDCGLTAVFLGDDPSVGSVLRALDAGDEEIANLFGSGEFDSLSTTGGVEGLYGVGGLGLSGSGEGGAGVGVAVIGALGTLDAPYDPLFGLAPLRTPVDATPLLVDFEVSSLAVAGAISETDTRAALADWIDGFGDCFIEGDPSTGSFGMSLGVNGWGHVDVTEVTRDPDGGNGEMVECLEIVGYEIYFQSPESMLETAVDVEIMWSATE